MYKDLLVSFCLLFARLYLCKGTEGICLYLIYQELELILWIIIGPVGSGKTYFSEKLSEKLNIKKYELDKVSWDDDNGNVKRSPEEVKKLLGL